MGSFNNEKPSTDGRRTPVTQPQHPSTLISEKFPPPSPRFLDRALTPVSMGSRASFTGSMRSTQSGFMEEIKHEVMVNYLFQQQCSRLWVGDGSGELEGVLIRKSRGNYMACPPQLANSAFAYYCAQLNLQVYLQIW